MPAKVYVLGKRPRRESAGIVRDYEIRPTDINMGMSFDNNFAEIRYAARAVVRFAQYRCGWVPFTRKDIEETQRKYSIEETKGFDLLELNGFIKKVGEKYSVTEKFVRLCVAEAPETEEDEITS